MSKYKVGMFLFFLLMLSVILVPAALADGGDFSLDFVASAPQTYNHDTGGGAFNDDTSNSDTVESLEGGTFVCGDIVTYLIEITVDGSATGTQTIQIDLQFGADSTGQTGVGIGDVVSTAINYGQVENGDDYSGTSPGLGGFGLDGGIDDDRQDSSGDTATGGSTASIISEGFSAGGGLFVSGATYDTTIQVDDLQAGEIVILRVDARLFCKPDSAPTGNVQANVDAAQVTAGGTGTINVGNQTISLKLGGSGTPSQVDFGDLPDDIGGQPNFPTLVAGNGARHVIGAGLYLGACVDSETDGQPTVAVTGDNLGIGGDIAGTCVGNNDEDGVTFKEGLAGNGGWSNGTVASGNGGALTIVVTGGNGIPQVFLSNGAGALFDVGTLYQSNGSPWVNGLARPNGPAIAATIAPGTYDVYFDIPAGFFDGVLDTTVYTRVRLSSAGGLSADGSAADGEVEDYIYFLSPTAISLREITAVNSQASIKLAAILLLLLVPLTVFVSMGKRRRTS